MRVLLLEPPLWPYETPAALLSRALPAPVLRFSSLIRDQLDRGTPAGIRIRERIESGSLVTDDLARGAVREHLSRSAPTAFLLTGFPFNPALAAAFDTDLHERGTPLDAVLLLRPTEPAVDQFVRHRATRRSCPVDGPQVYGPNPAGDPCRTCGGELVQRPGDHPEESRRKIDGISSTLDGIARHYAAQHLLRTVDALPSAEDSTALALAALRAGRPGPDARPTGAVL
ncbi:adenylate kinase family protein [Kitasatospora sp. NPDC096147]|uniref:adenylate kinase family protein n=1 Tax=Kitasatospora sp. NPDC096147 TaxID=3364093 RepID=UPI003826FD0E